MINAVEDYAKEFHNIWRLKFSHNTRQVGQPSNRIKRKVRTARHASPWAKGQRANTFVITDVDLTGRTTGRPYKRVLWISGTVSADRPYCCQGEEGKEGERGGGGDGGGGDDGSGEDEEEDRPMGRERSLCSS
ncbi:hypothetical protein HZH68_001619 [Vespula germanica]|uniref:Uncharacterized protein n=1 Tax=Vespula germanica TaxID=30212 RepID=A0A834U705_VESGE|nr:hypothetical protein HZH68_001619 [Vespula germanica]